MSKKGISQIKGPSEIRLGETAYYEVSRIYDLDDKKKVDAARWKLYALDFKHHGNWRELTPKAGTPPKIGYRVPVIVTNQSLVGSELMLEAYIYEPEKRIPPGLRIKVLPGIEKKITRVDLFKVDDTPINDDTVMKYGQTIKVKVYTQNMQNEMMKLSLYEDDAQGGGDSPKNKNNRVAYIKKPLNKKGFLVHEFKLNIDFAKIANAVMDGSHDKLHEYYVVVETAEHKSVSKNVEVQNPDYVKVQTVSSGVDTEKIYEGIVIEEVVITRKYKKQPGINPPVNTGNKVVTVFEPDEKEKKKEEVCECEARVRAFMRMLRVGEGTGELIKSSIYNKETKKMEEVYITHNFQIGYSTAFGGNKITDFTTHPQKVYGGSSAAGAYQVMRYTWWWMNGEELDDNNKKTGKYVEKHDYIKKYKILDYNPESQDKTCLVVMKAQRPNLIKKIINNEIENAIQSEACFIWASLPEIDDKSHYKFKGNRQPATKLKICIEHYNKFLQQELKGISNLHLKKGFLNDFGYDCCGESVSKSEIVSKCECQKPHYNISKPELWITQKPSECWAASVQVLKNYGVAGGSRANCIIMANQEGENLSSVNAKSGINYIDSQLKIGKPVVVGLDDNLRQTSYNAHKATDHFFVIVGAGCENGKRYYNFFDVGSKTRDAGTSPNNKMFINEDMLIEGKSNGGRHNYTITEVRKNN